jgi:flagellar hook-length control protein FliK
MYTQAAEETVIASKSAKETLVLPGQEAVLPAGTLKTTVADVLESAPMYTQAVREPAVAPGQVYNEVTTMAKGIEPENINFASLEEPATVRQGILFERPLAVGDLPVFEAGSPAANTVRAEAAAPDQVLKPVLPGSSPAAGQVVTGQEPAASPAVETRPSGEAVKSAGKEEIPATGFEADKDAAITGGKGTGGAVENNTPNNVSQYDSLSSISNSVDKQKTVKIADMRDTLVQEIKRAYYQQKSEPLTQVDLKLEPEHMGKLTIKLFFNGGELNAHFYAGNDYVKDALEGSIQQLRQTLDQQDLKLNQAFVFVGDGGRSGTGQSESGGRQPARYSGAYSGHTYGDIAAEPAVYEPLGHSYKMVNYLI